MVTDIDRQASPTARKMAEALIPSASSGIEGSVSARNCEPSASTSPSAPEARRMGSRNTQISAARSACNPVVSTIPTVAIRRARARSPMPMDRDTSATAPIIMPMATDMTANWIVPAIPTAAIIASTRSWEIHQSARKSTRNVKDRPSAPESAMVTTWRIRLPVTNFPCWGPAIYSAATGRPRAKIVSYPGSGWRGIISARSSEAMAKPAARPKTAPGDRTHR